MNGPRVWSNRLQLLAICVRRPFMFTAQMTIAGFDPELAKAIAGRTQSPGRSYRADRVGELHQSARARGSRVGAHQQVCRRLSRQALLRRLRIRRCGGEPGDRSGEAAVRRRLCQCTAAFRQPGERRRVPGAAQSGGYHPRHESRSWRPFDAWRQGEFLRQVVQSRAIRQSSPTTAKSTTTRWRAWRRSIAPKSSWRDFRPIRASSTGRGFAPLPTPWEPFSSWIWRMSRGWWAAGVYPNPVPFADVVTTTTHKTLRGPRGGLILARPHADLHKKFNSMVFPGTQGGPADACDRRQGGGLSRGAAAGLQGLFETGGHPMRGS